MPEDYIFEQDKQFSQFARVAPISLTSHDLAVRSLAGDYNDLKFFGKVIFGSYNNNRVIFRMLIGYNQTLRCMYKWAVLPLFGREKTKELWEKLQEANKMVTEKKFDVLDMLEEVELQIIELINKKKLLYETEKTEMGGD